MRNDKQFSSALTTAVKSANTARTLIQDLSIEALQWAVIYGDSSRLDRINAKLAEGFSTADCNKWLRWATAIDGVRIHKEKFRVSKEKLAVVVLDDLDLWHTNKAKEAKPAAEFDVQKFFDNSIKRLLKNTDNGAELNLLEQEALRAMQAALASRLTDKAE